MCLGFYLKYLGTKIRSEHKPVIQHHAHEPHNGAPHHDNDGPETEPGHGFLWPLVEKPKVGGHKAGVLEENDQVEGGHSVARPALLEVEEAEDVYNADHGVVEPLLPLVGAKVRVLPDNPARHYQPMSTCD